MAKRSVKKKRPVKKRKRVVDVREAMRVNLRDRLHDLTAQIEGRTEQIESFEKDIQTMEATKLVLTDILEHRYGQF